MYNLNVFKKGFLTLVLALGLFSACSEEAPEPNSNEIESNESGKIGELEEPSKPNL